MNHTARICLCVLLGLFLATVTSEFAKGITADEIFKAASSKYANVMSSVKDITLEQEMTMTQGDVKTLMKVMRKGNKFRLETTTNASPGTGGAGMPEMKTTVVSDGKETWMVAPFAGKKKLSQKEAADFSKGFDWTDIIKGRLSLLGKENVSGREAWAIDVKQDQLPSDVMPFSKVWIDAANYWLLKYESSSSAGTTMSRLSDFRKVIGDFSMPYLQETFLNGVLKSKTITKYAKVNTGLSDDLFDPSKLEAKGMNLQDILQGMPGN